MISQSRQALDVHSSLETEHNYVWTSSDIKRVFRRPLYLELIESAELTRLSNIRFLGAIDYLIHPNGRELSRRRHTRFEHTLGVAQLALLYSCLMELNESDEANLICAALLHDVGHSPLSHSLEGAFSRQFGINHHQAGRFLILGEAPKRSGKTIPSILAAHNIDPETVIATINGQSTDRDIARLFGHPVNVDTIEAICRSETYIKDRHTSLSPNLVLRALVNPTQLGPRLDDFWQLKGQIYALLIQGPIGLLADFVASNYVERHPGNFTRDDYFKNEREFRRAHPALFAELDRVRLAIARFSGGRFAGEIVLKYQARKFYVDPSAPFGSEQRYNQAKFSSDAVLPNFLLKPDMDNEEIAVLNFNELSY